MDKDVWIRRWRSKALELFMDKMRLVTGPREIMNIKANAILDAPGELDALLSRMYDDLQPKPLNGKAHENRKPIAAQANEIRQ
jgi:hypothetical protein